MRRVTASFARSLKESHMVMKTGPRMTLSRTLSSTNDVHNKLHGLCTNEEKVSKIFKELFGTEKKYEVKKVANNGVSDVIKSDVLKTGSMGIDVVKGEEGVISDTVRDGGVSDAVTCVTDVVKGEDVVIGDTVRDGGVIDGVEGVTSVLGDGWVMDVGNRLSEASVAFLKELVDAALGNATGGALLWRILEDFAVLAGSSTVLITAYVAGRWVIQKYKHRNITKCVVSPQNHLYVFKIVGLVEGTAHSWIDKGGVLHVSGVQRIKNQQLRFEGLSYQLPNGYALAHATHYAKLEAVAVHVKFKETERIDLNVDVVSEEIAEMIVDKKELDEEVKGTARDNKEVEKEVEKEVSDAEDVGVVSEDVDELDEEVKGTARVKKEGSERGSDAEEGKCHV